LELKYNIYANLLSLLILFPTESWFYKINRFYNAWRKNVGLFVAILTNHIIKPALSSFEVFGRPKMKMVFKNIGNNIFRQISDHTVHSRLRDKTGKLADGIYIARHDNTCGRTWSLALSSSGCWSIVVLYFRSWWLTRKSYSRHRYALKSRLSIKLSKWHFNS